MFLREYLKSVPRKQLASKIGKDKRYLDNLLYGARPSVSIARQIEIATDGAVSRDELLFPELYNNMPDNPCNPNKSKGN